MTDALDLRFTEQRARLATAAEKAGRAASDVTLLAVSKFQSEASIRAAYAWGQRDFGENYVQELADKAAALADLSELRWHLIGHLQSNKAKVVAPFVTSVQTVSSLKLAAELGRRVRERRPEALGPLRVLVEVNLGAELGKSGLGPAELESVLAAIEAEPRLELRGLMTIPPQTERPEQALPFFRLLAQLRDLHGGAPRLPELSMGMSADVEQAVEAGATIVRVGTALFGAR